MRLEYQHITREKVPFGTGFKIYGQRVKPGYILKVLTCFLHMPDSADKDIAEILVDDGGQELEIRSRARDAGKQGMSTLNPFYVGEYQRVVGHAPLSSEDETLCLTVIGELIPLKKWRKGKV